MARAHDARALSGYAARQQLVAAVPAIVGVRAEHAVVVAAQQDAAVADGLGALIGRVRQLGAEAHARPATAEEILLFPAEDGGIYACGRGQHAALAERLERISKACGTDGAVREIELTDHTVNRRPQ